MRTMVETATATLVIFGFVLAAQTSPEPGASPGVALQDISRNGPEHSSAFPFVTVSPANDGTVAIGWRLYSLPIDTNAPKSSRTADCHISVSKDRGETFKATNLMNVLRTVRTETEPELWYCNAPWTAV